MMVNRACQLLGEETTPICLLMLSFALGRRCFTTVDTAKRHVPHREREYVSHDCKKRAAVLMVHAPNAHLETESSFGACRDCRKPEDSQRSFSVAAGFQPARLTLHRLASRCRTVYIYIVL